MNKAILLLKNGEVFKGRTFGYKGETTGEVVFNTSMTGYQEVLTDPSYNSQIVTMTYTQIGNYGVNRNATESKKIQVAGFVVREVSKIHSNWSSEGSLSEYMEAQKIVGIEGIDTRKLTRILRITGAQNGIISAIDFDLESLKRKLAQVPDMSGLDLVPNVTLSAPERWGEHKQGYFNVVAIDCGIKTNILRLLNASGCNITVVPATYTAEQILSLSPDGVFLSNGPGDPRATTYVTETVKKLLGKTPIFGICLGHQILSLALGAEIFKLKFGHRGANQPAMRMHNRNVEITSQNHGFAVKDGSVSDEVLVTHMNLNDNTVEGIRHKKYPAFSVQYHPEASPGPHDSQYLFGEFVQLMRDFKRS